MVRREVLDDFLRQRAKSNGATLINGLFLGMTLPQKKGDSYVLTFNDYEGEEGNARKGEKKTLEVDVVIGADGANSRVAKDIEAGDYESMGLFHTVSLYVLLVLGVFIWNQSSQCNNLRWPSMFICSTPTRNKVCYCFPRAHDHPWWQDGLLQG